MGQSRSASVVIGYLLWKSAQRRHPNTTQPGDPIYGTARSFPRDDTSPIETRGLQLNKPESLTPETALELVRNCRPIIEPNDGFMEQLWLYYSMGCPGIIESHPQYQRWLYRQTVKRSLHMHKAPDVAQVRFEDEHDEFHPGNSTSTENQHLSKVEIRCRRCRHLLAQSKFLVDHQPAITTTSTAEYQFSHQCDGGGSNCAHIFVQPLSWMRPYLVDGLLDGRLICPNHLCNANIGKYAWQGMKCSCTAWVTPGFGLSRSKVDEAPVPAGSPALLDRPTSSAMKIRMPPDMRRA